MTSLEQAAADLREAQKNLDNHTPKDKLENAVEKAKAAVLKAALMPSVEKTLMVGKDEPEIFIPADVEIAATFPEKAAASETTDCVAEAADELFEEAAIPEVDANVQAVESATMQDVMASVTAAAATIDATDEVSVEEAIEAAEEPAIDPNAQLGENYKANGVIAE